jgi:hypothetical protein
LRRHSLSVRAAVVGRGKMGLLHTSLLHAHPDVEVVAACETSRTVRHLGTAMLPSARSRSGLKEPVFLTRRGTNTTSSRLAISRLAYRQMRRSSR